MNNSVTVYEEHRLTETDIRAQVNLIQHVMKAVMKGPSKDNPAGVHYGIIPGTPKPTLYKPGAEVLCATFRISPEFTVEDLSTSDCYRYRVTCKGRHQTTGIVLAEGMGSASSNEDKYRWRRIVCEEEFEATPSDRRRIKYAKGKESSFYTVKQIRAEPDDIDNTVLKMACKRAQVAMTLNATAASDIFTQDVEDIPETMRQTDGDGGEAKERKKPQPKGKPPAAEAKANGNGEAKADAEDGPATPAMVNHLKKRLEGAALTDVEFFKKFNVTTFEGLKVSQINAALHWAANPAE
jgi:hypothetical protein